MDDLEMRTPIVVAILLLACTSDAKRSEDVASAKPEPPSERMAEALTRFRVSLPEIRTLAEASPTRDALVQRFVAAIEKSDSSAFAGMIMTRTEFAWLYYPSTKYTRPPYEMEPELLWFFLLENGQKGIGRALREYGGRRLGYEGYSCATEPEVQGRNRLWQGCVLRLGSRQGVVEKRLFGSILERDGRFKFVSFANDL